MIKKSARLIGWALLCVLAALPTSRAQAQARANAVITGKVLSDFGQPLDVANVYLNELSISVPTNAQGVYTLTVPAARVTGQAVNLRVRAIGYQPGLIAIKVTEGTQEQNFALKKDINRLSEVVVTGSIEGTERSKVPFAVGRLTAEDIPVPALDPLRALQGKVAGMRIAQTGGAPGSTPQIMLRGPTSINTSGRTTGPMIIVDGAIMRVASLEEIGGLDIESVEVVKGASGASLYGSTAANGVIIIKTKRGASQDGVKFNFRSEYGFSDLNSLDYGQPVNHHLQLDETGKRFCISGSGAQAPCARTMDFMTELQRINGVNADTVRTPQSFQFNAMSSGGELLNAFQANIWPNRYYNSFAQVTTRNPVTLNQLDASGRAGGVRYFASGSFTNDAGAIKGLKGQQQRRGRVNLDYDVRNNLLVSISTLFDRATTDNRSGGSAGGGIFGQLLRGAPSGADYLARDTLGRLLVKAGGAGIRGSGNGAGTFLYDMENLQSFQDANRLLSSLGINFFPADWVTFEGNISYDNRQRTNYAWENKGYRTFTPSTSDNFGNESTSGRSEEALNASLAATFRKELRKDLSGKLSFRALYDQDVVGATASSGEQFVVRDVYTLSNTSTNFATSSSSSKIANSGISAAMNLDWKGKYILDGTVRRDGSSLFGAGNRFATFGRLSAVWRVSEEPFFKVPGLSDFRLRASRGTAGSTPSFTAQYETYSCSSTGCSLGQAGNPKLKPETTTETEIGADFTLFNRLGVEITNSQASTVDQLLNVPTQATLGFSRQWQNAGTLASRTWELALNLPIVTKRDLQWSVRGTYDRTRTSVTALSIPEYYADAPTGNGTGSLFLITARTDIVDGVKANLLGNEWGRKFYKSCGDLPTSVQASCGAGKDFQVDDRGWLVWTGAGNTTADGITKNLWQSKLPAALSPWNYPLQFGHPIVDRPLRGEKGEGIGRLHILGNSLPGFRAGLNSTLTYKRMTLYGLLDGTFGFKINNQGEGWGLFDFNSSNFDQAKATVATAKPVGYTWRVGGSEGVGSGGFYDILGPNNYNTEDGSFVKLRELSLSYRVGRIAGIGEWSVSVIGRNMYTWTKYSGYDPETGAGGLINQVDAFAFPTLRTFTFSISTRF